MSESAPAWETSKENVLPVKRGRSAKGLSDALSKPKLHSEQENLTHIADFDKELQNCPTDQANQRLEIYIKYIKWVRDAYPGSAEKVFELLERCTVDFKNNEDMKNDSKLVALWIEYADMVHAPGEIFAFMQANKIGERVSLFWIAWAYVAERAQNFKLTDQIFQKGTRRLAEPKELLSKRYKQFQRRMARQFLNGGAAGDGADSSSSSSSGTIDEAITAAAMNAIRNAPSVAPSSAAATSAGTGASAPKRRALYALDNPAATAPITAASSSENVAIVANSSRSHSVSNSNASSRVRPAGTRPPQSSAGRNTTSANQQGSGFQIFSDQPASSRSTLAPHLYEPQLDEARSNGSEAQGSQFPSTYGTLGTAANRRKENDGPVTKWSQGPLSGVSVPSSTTPAPETSIPIFVDPQFEAQESVGEDQQSGNPHHQPAANVLSVRRQLDTLEAIVKNPLARHNQTTATAAPAPPIPVPTKVPEELPVFTAAAPPPSAAIVVAPTSLNQARQSSHKPASVRAAAGFAIFCDDSSASAGAVKTTPSSKTTAVTKGAATAFSIYNTNSSTTEASADSRVHAKITAKMAPAPAFDIFVDETPAVASSKQPAAPAAASLQHARQSFAIFESPVKAVTNTTPGGFDIYADASGPAVSGQSIPTHVHKNGGFDIYMDEPAVSLASSAPAVPPSIQASSAFDIHVDEPAVTGMVGNKAPTTVTTMVPAVEGLGEDDQDGELHAILDNMMQLDSEDGTINTRLAKRDIDLMFCSPTIHRAPAPAATTRRQGTGTTAATITDENSFCLRKPEPACERELFDDEDHFDSSFVGSRTVRKPLQETDCSRIIEEEVPSFDQFDNDAAESTAQKLIARAGDQEGPGVLLKARHRPFGVHLDNPFSAVKDLSAIKESSQEFSMCGTMLLETPGHTGTLGFGGRRAPFTGARTGGAARYSNMFGDLSAMDFSQNSRESLGSILSSAPAGGTAPVGSATSSSSSSAGFQIFEDSAPVDSQQSSDTTTKRKGLGTYSGIEEAGTTAPLPSRRRLYNPFSVDSAGSHSRQQRKQQLHSAQQATAKSSHSKSFGGAVKRRSPAVASSVSPSRQIPNLRTPPPLAVLTENVPALHAVDTKSPHTPSLFLAEQRAEATLNPTSSSAAPVFAPPKSAASLSPSLSTSSALGLTLPGLVRDIPHSTESEILQGSTVLEPSLFYTLEVSTFTTILNSLTQYYEVQNIRNKARGHMEIVQRLFEAHPSSFSFRTKPNTATTFPLPHGPPGEHWSVVGNIGRGTYGHAVLLQRKAGPQERRVFKVDTSRDSVLWEAFIHMQMQHRFVRLPVEVRECYAQYVLRPTALLVYRDSAALQMPYSEWGTLVTVLSVLATQKGLFSLQGHEYICAYLSLQMVEALLVVHSAGMLHCDVKTDNWVVGAGDKGEGVRVRLIDFGRSLSAWFYSADPFPLYDNDGDMAAQQLETIERLYDGELHDKQQPQVPVQYRGEVAVKSYQCMEMRREEAWSYQSDLHGLCCCIHQLLHLQPLACSQEDHAQLHRRGLDWDAAVNRLFEEVQINQTAVSAQAPPGCRTRQHTAPQASLKRYWRKGMWSAVYLLLLNSADALGQVTAATVIDNSRATVLLRTVRRVLLEYMQEAQQDVGNQASLSLLRAELQRREV